MFKLLLEAKNMPYLLESVLSHLYLKDLKKLSHVSTDFKIFADRVYEKRRLKIINEFNIDQDKTRLFRKAIIDGNLDLLFILMEKNGSDHNELLEIAIEEGKVEVVKLLIEEGNVTVANKVLQQDVNVDRLLINHGVKVTQDNLNMAATRGHLDLVRLVFGTDPA